MKSVEDILNNARSQEPRAKKSEPYKFPIGVFPKVLQDLSNELERVSNYPKDYTAGALILSFATAVGNTRRIRLKRGYTDNLCFYIVAVGNAGSNKTRPFNTILKPIKDKDYNEYLDYKKRLGEVSNEAPKPKQLNYILSDFTPETIARSLEANDRGLLIFNDEVLQWLKSFNRYSKGGALEMYLSLWSGQSIKVNRASGECISVKNPLLNIGGTIQPSKLNEAFNDDGSGFLDRFLFLYPMEEQPNEWNLLNLNAEIFTHYNEAIKRAFDFAEFNEEGEAKYIDCSHEAQGRILEYVNSNKKGFKGLDEWEISLLEKLHSYLLRFCLLIYCMDFYTLENKDREEITIEVVERAILLVEYFRNTAYRVRDTIRNGTDYISTLNETKQNFYNALNENFATSEAVELGANLGFNERAVFRFLREKKLFKKKSKGYYIKLI